MKHKNEIFAVNCGSTPAMTESYEEVVKKWYVKLRPDFTLLMMKKFRKSEMRLADVENIYQDIFLALHRNLQLGRISAGCDWKNYIIRVGINMAIKKCRVMNLFDSIDGKDEIDEEKLSPRSERILRVSELLRQLQADDEDPVLYEDEKAHAILCRELGRMPGQSADIIRCTYFFGMTDAEIAGELESYRSNGKSLAVNAKAVKARRWAALQELGYRVKRALFNAEITDRVPQKRKRCAARA